VFCEGMKSEYQLATACTTFTICCGGGLSRKHSRRRPSTGDQFVQAAASSKHKLLGCEAWLCGRASRVSHKCCLGVSKVSKAAKRLRLQYCYRVAPSLTTVPSQVIYKELLSVSWCLVYTFTPSSLFFRSAVTE